MITKSEWINPLLGGNISLMEKEKVTRLPSDKKGAANTCWLLHIDMKIKEHKIRGDAVWFLNFPHKIILLSVYKYIRTQFNQTYKIIFSDANKPI